MDRKKLPLFLMLLAGAITSIMTFMLEYTFKDMLFAILVVLIIFGTIGHMIRKMLDYFDKQNKKRAEEEGEVIEKESDSESEGESKKETDSKAEADSKAEE